MALGDFLFPHADLKLVIARTFEADVESAKDILSKEFLEDDRGRKVFGTLAAAGRESLGPILWNAPVVSITQEHGIIRMDEALFSETEIGDVVYILPVHSCLTCNLHREYRTLDGHVIRRM